MIPPRFQHASQTYRASGRAYMNGPVLGLLHSRNSEEFRFREHFFGKGMN
jgi:hypothetical protein